LTPNLDRVQIDARCWAKRNWFIKGLDTADLKNAKALLEELSNFRQ